MLIHENGTCKSANGENAGSMFVNRSTTKGSSFDVSSSLDRPHSDPYHVKPGEKPYKLEIVWRNVLAFVYLHTTALLAFTYPAKLSMLILQLSFAAAGSFGISSGAHRLWAHKSYKANMKLRAMLLVFQTIAVQNCMIEWVRDHRVHHKYSDTNADPHNASRGFFFSHIGWLMCKKHPDVRKYGSRVDMSDLESDPMLKFQEKHYKLLVVVISFFLPCFLGSYVLGRPWMESWHWTIFRYMTSLHITWLTNSVSHLWGSKPFEKGINPTDTRIVGFLAFGEGWHNFHHVYPWDYKVSELPHYRYNFSILFIDFFAWLGWATDLKTVSDEMVRKRVLRTGDGSHRYSERPSKGRSAAEIMESLNNNNQPEEHIDNLWGWDDNDMNDEERSGARILHPKLRS